MPQVNRNVYNASPLRAFDGIVDRVITRKREEMFSSIFASGPVRLDAIADVLDVGSTKDNDYASSNFFARRLAASAPVTLLSDQPIDPARDVDFAVERVVVGDATRFGTEVGHFDLVFSSATIEHVGSAENQRRMIECCVRVARRFVVVTTPNRWHPIEFHTRLPLLHWLPRRLHRRLLAAIGFPFFADEANLNLLDRRSLEALIETNSERGRIRTYRIETVRLFGFASNLVCTLEVEAPA